jgi:Rrf2 family protein
VYELACNYGAGPVKIARIAQVQAIPQRFLELILNELRRGGFVDSKRGSAGGYLLVRPPQSVTVGEIIRFVDGPIGPVECVVGKEGEDCPLYPNCAFLPLWTRAREAVEGVYDTTTFQDLVEGSVGAGRDYVPGYAI